MLNSLLIDERAGDIMEEDIGETSVKADTINVAAHLRFIDQFFGFAGSSVESHVTLYDLGQDVLKVCKYYLQDQDL